MSNLNVDESIKKLGLDVSIINKLEENNIKTINDLWCLKRKELKIMNFNTSEINHIIIKMQLCGLDLNKKMYI